ncbi:unnamed protein product [Amoebophrya sp. A25]|nr:unnamed protein product [Amoebophrya sp. A25]|eukprot:GSA25T00014258001.1
MSSVLMPPSKEAVVVASSSSSDKARTRSEKSRTMTRRITDPTLLTLVAQSMQLLLLHEAAPLPVETYHRDPFEPTWAETRFQAQHIAEADFDYMQYGSRDPLPAKAFRLDSRALSILMSHWQKVTLEFITRTRPFMETRQKGRRDKDQAENQKLVDESYRENKNAEALQDDNINMSDSEIVNNVEEQDFSFQGDASVEKTENGEPGEAKSGRQEPLVSAENETAFAYEILAYHCGILKRKFEDIKYVSNLFTKGHNLRYFPVVPKLGPRAAARREEALEKRENTAKLSPVDINEDSSIPGDRALVPFNFTNLAHKLSGDLTWAKRVYRKELQQVKQILDAFPDPDEATKTDDETSFHRSRTARVERLKKEYPHLLSAYPHHERTIPRFRILESSDEDDSISRVSIVEADINSAMGQINLVREKEGRKHDDEAPGLQNDTESAEFFAFNDAEADTGLQSRGKMFTSQYAVIKMNGDNYDPAEFSEQDRDTGEWVASHALFVHHPEIFQTSMKLRLKNSADLFQSHMVRGSGFVERIIRPVVRVFRAVLDEMFWADDFPSLHRLSDAEAGRIAGTSRKAARGENNASASGAEDRQKYDSQTCLPVFEEGDAVSGILGYRENSMKVLIPDVFSAFDRFMHGFDGYYRLYASTIAAENVEHTLQNNYDMEIEVHHAKIGYTVTCTRDVYKSMVRAAQSVQYLHESIASVRSLISGGRTDESLRFVKQKQVTRWEDAGENHAHCFRDELFAREIDVYLNKNHSHSKMARRLLGLPRVDYEFVHDFPGLVEMGEQESAAFEDEERSTSFSSTPLWIRGEAKSPESFAANSRFHVLHYIVLHIRRVEERKKRGRGVTTAQDAADDDAPPPFFFAEIGTRHGDTPRYLMGVFPWIYSLIVDIFWIDSTGAEIFQRYPGRASFIKGDSAKVSETRIRKQFFNKVEALFAGRSGATQELASDVPAPTSTPSVGNHLQGQQPKRRPASSRAKSKKSGHYHDHGTAAADVTAAGGVALSASSTSLPGSSCSIFLEKKFHLIFLDGDHSYEGVKRDVLAWWPRVRSGGVLAGHDFDMQWFGVVVAVLDFVVKENLKLWLGPDAVWWVYKD